MMTHTETIQQLYLAYFQRPADAAGLDYWSYALDHGYYIGDIREQFSKASEFQNLTAGKSHAQVVDMLYLNLFGRHPDQAGLSFYTKMLDQGDATVSHVADDIIRGASGGDADIIYNKVVAAELFTTALGIEPANAAAYVNNSAAGRVFLATVTDDASLYTALGKLPDSLEIVMTQAGAGARVEGGRAVQGAVVVGQNAMSVEAAVQELYLAYFKRPADVAGLNFWHDAIVAGSVQEVSQKFAQSGEYQDSIKGLGSEAIVDNFYLNLFGHHADSAGLQFYSAALAAGKVGIDQLVLGLMSGAQPQDAELLENRVIASGIFTTALNIDPFLSVAYSSSLEYGSAYLAPINNDDSVYAAVRGLPAVLHKMEEALAAHPLQLMGVAAHDAAIIA